MPTAQSTTSSTNAKAKQPATKQNSAGKSSSAASATSSGAVVNTTKQTLSSESGEAPQQQEHQTATAAATTTTTGGGVRTPQEQPEFIKQALIIIEKKVRNLDKRRQKLEEYKESQRKGQQLNEDQQCAVNKYEEVLRSLELSKELEKQFVGLANDAMKQQKKQAKKEQIEREELIKEKIKESQKFITVLDTFGDESVRNDFLHEANGAIKLTEQELKMLDDFDSLVTQTELGAKLESSASEASEHLVGLIEAKNKPVSALPGGKITYQDLRKLFDRIMSCAYWTQEPTPAAAAAPQQPEEPSATTTDTTTTVVESNEQADNQATSVTAPSPTNAPMSELASNEPQPNELPTAMAVHENKIEQLNETAQQYHQQNTSDDFVIVNSNDLNEHQHSKSPNQQQMQPQQQQQQQQPPKTFFTTLNPADLPAHRNINEFINKCENNDDGINFLQDSQIQQRHHQQQQEQHQHHQQQQQQHHQQHHHNQQQHIDEMNYQPTNQPNNNNFNNYNSNQDPNHNDFQKDNSFKQQQRGPRPDGGNRDQNGGNRPYQPRQQRPYPDDRRSGGPPRNGGGAPMRNMGANNGGNVSQPQQSSYRNGERGGEQQQRGGDRGGYRGGPSGGPAGGQRGGYGYRGPNPNPAGPRQPGNNGQRYQQQAPRGNQDLHQHQEAQMA